MLKQRSAAPIKRHHLMPTYIHSQASEGWSLLREEYDDRGLSRAASSSARPSHESLPTSARARSTSRVVPKE
jgi:hypothetical protein